MELICSSGTMVKTMDLADEDRAAAICLVTSPIVVTGVSSRAIMYLSRSVLRQRGMRAAGVDGKHERRTMREVSE